MIIGQSLHSFADTLCTEYISSGCYTKIYDAVTAVEAVEEGLRWEKAALFEITCGLKQRNKPVYCALGNPTRGKAT